MKIKLTQIKWMALLLCLSFISSCKEDLPAYDLTNITKVGFYHRFIGPDKDQLTGEFITIEKELSCQYTLDEENGTALVKVTVPVANGKFTEAERAKVTQSKLWGYVNVSSAARISPIDGSQKLGTADDWTKEHKFRVTAANGLEKIWTIKVVEFNP